MESGPDDSRHGGGAGGCGEVSALHAEELGIHPDREDPEDIDFRGESGSTFRNAEDLLEKVALGEVR